MLSQKILLLTCQLAAPHDRVLLQTIPATKNTNRKTNAPTTKPQTLATHDATMDALHQNTSAADSQDHSSCSPWIARITDPLVYPNQMVTIPHPVEINSERGE